MSQDLKTFLIALALAPLALGMMVYQCGEQSREKAARAAAKEKAEKAAYAALSSEEKLREEILQLTEYRHGQTIDGLEALQLTIRHDYVGFFTSLPDELNSAASRHIEAAYQTHPTIQTLDIDYHIKVADPYGAESYTPGLRIQIDRPNFERIEWNNFLPKNIPKVCNLYQPLHPNLLQ
jgi:hypothetical protein